MSNRKTKGAGSDPLPKLTEALKEAQKVVGTITLRMRQLEEAKTRQQVKAVIAQMRSDRTERRLASRKK